MPSRTKATTDPTEMQVNARIPVDLVRAFDLLYGPAGYTTRQECLRNLMRRFVMKEGAKQIGIIQRTIEESRKHTGTR